MTNILICADWFYPAYKAGGPVQSIVNLVNTYQRPGVRFFIFCSNTDLDGTVNANVSFDCWHPYNEHTQVWYASPGKLTAAVLKEQVRIVDAQILYVIGMFSWYSNRMAIFFERSGIRTIISVRGMLHPGALTQKAFKKKIFLKLWKLSGQHRRYLFHATDEQEKLYIHQMFGESVNIFVAGNFPRVLAYQPARTKSNGILKLVSIALLGPMKNIDLVLEALQYCRSQLSYHIYGPIKDAAYWNICLSKITSLPFNITASYHGDLMPDKVEEALENASVFILPSKSENFGHALYEALSAGKPIITSHYTPFNQLSENYAGKNVAIDDTKELAAAIDFFAAMPEVVFAQWSEGASVYARQYIDLDRIMLQYDAMFLIDIS